MLSPFCLAKELGIKQVGSFKCIMEKIDLSTHEAENSLFEWTENFEKMKQELSVRSLAQSLNAARSPYTVKILAYKNGEGRLKPPILIIGSSIRGVSIRIYAFYSLKFCLYMNFLVIGPSYS